MYIALRKARSPRTYAVRVFHEVREDEKIDNSVNIPPSPTMCSLARTNFHVQYEYFIPL